MKKYYLLYVVFALFQATPLTSFAQAKKQYNVLFIIIHDMNNRIGFLGNQEPYTPNLNRLAARGMVFRNHYCQYPLCNPSRTTLLTGWRPDKSGIINNLVRPRTLVGPDVQFIPEYFDAFGYRTERYGHITHGTFDFDITWDYAEPDERGGTMTMENIQADAGAWWINNIPDSNTSDGIATSHLINRLQQPLNEPFFFGLGYGQTHAPFTPDLDSWNLNGDNSTTQQLPDESGDTSLFTGNGSGNIQLPNTPPGDRLDIPAVAFSINPLQKNDYEWKRTIHAYDAEVTQADKRIGLVLDELDRQNLWENTIVVFMSDHGQHLGEHEGAWLKMTLFEESLNIPLIISVPGKKPGICTRITEHADVYATLVELCGLPPAPGLEGSSLVPLLDNPAFEWKRAAFGQVARRDTLMGRTIRTEQYRYTFWGVNGEELYHHTTDPFEYTNLAKNPAYNAVLQEMRTIMEEGWSKSLPPAYPLLTFYRDFDNDGFGTMNDTLLAYAPLPGYVTNSNDCNDSNASVYPGAKEICNGYDDNCNNIIDEGKPVPVVTPLGNLDICETGSVILRTNAGADYRYQWKRNGQDIAGATRRNYTAVTTGKYRVQISNLAGCTTLSKNTIVTSSCSTITPQSALAATGTSDADQTLRIFPDPSPGQLTVTYQSSKQQASQIIAVDGTGKTVYNKSFNAIAGKNTLQVNLSNVASGTYYLEIKNESGIKRKAFIIHK